MLTDSARRMSQRLVAPLALALGRLGLTPNALTVIGCLLHLAVVLPLWRGNLVAAGLMLALAAAFDSLDGTLARLTGRASPFGAFLDSALDRVSEILVFTGLLVWALLRRPGDAVLPVIVLLALAGSIMTSYTRARSEALGLGTKAGVLGRLERMLLLVLGLVLAGLSDRETLVDLTVWVLLAGTWLTTVMRVMDVRRRAVVP